MFIRPWVVLYFQASELSRFSRSALVVGVFTELSATSFNSHKFLYWSARCLLRWFLVLLMVVVVVCGGGVGAGGLGVWVWCGGGGGASSPVVVVVVVGVPTNEFPCFS